MWLSDFCSRNTTPRSLVPMLLLLFLVVPSVRADQMRGSCGGLSAVVTEFGLAAIEIAGFSEPSAGTLSHSVRAKSFRFVERTDRIPLRAGMAMAMDYEVSGLPPDRPITLLHVKRFPLMTAPDGRTSTQSSATLNARSKDGAWRGRQYWVFEPEYPFEFVPGAWSFQVYYENCLLLEKTFTAFRP